MKDPFYYMDIQNSQNILFYNNNGNDKLYSGTAMFFVLC